MINVELLNHYQKLGIRPSTTAQGPLRNPEFGIWNLESGIRNPESALRLTLRDRSGIRNSESGIWN